MKDELILIKLGGSVLTDKTKKQVLRADVLTQLISEIKAFRSTHRSKLILAHGAGSFGHEAAKKYRTKEGLTTARSLYGMADVGVSTQPVLHLLFRCYAGTTRRALQADANLLSPITLRGTSSRKGLLRCHAVL